VVPDVAPADDGERIVHYHEFVVHPVVETVKVRHVAEDTRTAVSKRVEDADLDIWMRIYGSDGRVPARKGIVVHQYADTNPTVGGLDQSQG